MRKPLTWMFATAMACGQAFALVAATMDASAADALWSPGPALPGPRINHQAFALRNGGVMVIAGSDASGTGARTAVISDARLTGWTVSRSFDRVDMSACVLASGRVLVTGGRRDGSDDGKSSVCELYDPETGTWSPTGALHVGRYLHVVEALPDGGAVVIGGISDATDPMDPGNDHIAYENPIERYDPVLRTWTAARAIAPGARSASAALTDGRVLVMGGFRGMDSGSLNPGGWLYDPADDSVSVVSPWSASEFWVDFALVALPDGRALRAGGIAYYDPSGAATDTAEVFGASANAWTETGSLPRARAGHAIAHFVDDHLVDADGSNPAVYDPAAGSWTPAPSRSQPTTAGTLTRLHDGRLIAIGGIAASAATAATWILCPPMDVEPSAPTAGGSAGSGTGTTAPTGVSASVGDSGHGCGMGGAIALIAIAIASSLRGRCVQRLR